jgi:lipoyl synthase
MIKSNNLIEKARDLSYEYFGKEITFYVPGMITYNGKKGKYPAISLTGDVCELQCKHCNGRLLKSMIPTITPDGLIKKCKELKKEGNIGVLLSGGCLQDGSIPWKNFIPAIKFIKENYNLFVSIHSGLIDNETAFHLKKAGVDQALIDVIGDDKTLKNIYNLDCGIIKIEESLKALNAANIPTVPHILIGIDYGEIIGEYKAIDIISRNNPESIVFVSLMNLTNTTMNKVDLPDANEIADIMAYTRIKNPDKLMSLGCARERGNHEIELAAIECGINKIAIPSDLAIKKAKDLGLKIIWTDTCCSVPVNYKREK